MKKRSSASATTAGPATVLSHVAAADYATVRLAYSDKRTMFRRDDG